MFVAGLPVNRCSPKVADEDDETLTLLPLEHLLVGQHYTPLGLRLTRQLFLIFDQDGDDRLSADELHMLNIVRIAACQNNPLAPNSER